MNLWFLKIDEEEKLSKIVGQIVYDFRPRSKVEGISLLAHQSDPKTLLVDIMLFYNELSPKELERISQYTIEQSIENITIRIMPLLCQKHLSLWNKERLEQACMIASSTILCDKHGSLTQLFENYQKKRRVTEFPDMVGFEPDVPFVK